MRKLTDVELSKVCAHADYRSNELTINSLLDHIKVERQERDALLYDPVTAEKLVWTCLTPHIHKYSTQEYNIVLYQSTTRTDSGYAVATIASSLEMWITLTGKSCPTKMEYIKKTAEDFDPKNPDLEKWQKLR
jgi:hypothetical protein